MKTLNTLELQSVSGAVGFSEFAMILSGSAVGAAIAAKSLSNVQVAWLGLIPLPLTIAGGMLGGSIGHIIYNVEQETSNNNPTLSPIVM